MMYRCKYCGRMYDVSDYTDEDEAATDCCPDCYYSGNMFSVEDDTDDIDVSDEEFEEDTMSTILI